MSQAGRFLSEMTHMRVTSLLLICLSLVAYSQETPASPKIGELVTDRPDFTESAEVVPRGWLQWESGFQFDRSGDTRGYTFGAPLLRFGFSKRFELRLATDGVVGQRGGGTPLLRGMADSSVGFKYKFVDESKWLPSFSVIPAVSLPSGHPVFTSAKADPGVKFALGKDIPLGFSLSSNIKYNSLSDGIGRYNQSAVTISVGHGFGERFAGYWELYSFNCDERASGRMTVFQTGVTTAVGQNAQLDVSIGRRLTTVGPDWLVSFGWATRHPLGFISKLKR